MRAWERQPRDDRAQRRQPVELRARAADRELDRVVDPVRGADDRRPAQPAPARRSRSSAAPAAPSASQQRGVLAEARVRAGQPLSRRGVSAGPRQQQQFAVELCESHGRSLYEGDGQTGRTVTAWAGREASRGHRSAPPSGAHVVCDPQLCRASRCRAAKGCLTSSNTRAHRLAVCGAPRQRVLAVVERAGQRCQPQRAERVAHHRQLVGEPLARSTSRPGPAAGRAAVPTDAA